MATVTIGEARFIVPSNDHTPMHVHVLIGESRFILDILNGGTVKLSSRADARKPLNAKKTDERRALRIAKKNYTLLSNICHDVHAQRGNTEGD